MTSAQERCVEGFVKLVSMVEKLHTSLRSSCPMPDVGFDVLSSLTHAILESFLSRLLEIQLLEQIAG